FQIPDQQRQRLPEKKKDCDTIRYEVRIGYDSQNHLVGILEERALLKQWCARHPEQRELFPLDATAPDTIVIGKAPKGARTILSKNVSGDHFYLEVAGKSGKGWFPSIRLGPKKSAIGNLPEDESKFPVSTWLKNVLTQGVQRLILNSLEIRKASPPGRRQGFLPDGSNLPWVIKALRRKDESKFQNWLRHVRTALPEIKHIDVKEKEDDRHAYLIVHYEGGFKAPSWVISDGTLRLLALTLPAYLPDIQGIYLIEEPENGIHPGAVETVYQSLSSVYDAQILLATHSPVILSHAEVDKVLCFKKTESGAADIVRGSEHPKLKDWKGSPNLSVLYASGVLG
ncbi:MAG: ATP-binding protein, partial [Elusimicrobia bacterium]|nr:ATP-binding protein [Elusimicrobiota bacterium]